MYAIIRGTPGDYIELIIGVTLGFFLLIWLLIVFRDWIASKPWQKRDAVSEMVNDQQSDIQSSECEERGGPEWQASLPTA